MREILDSSCNSLWFIVKLFDLGAGGCSYHIDNEPYWISGVFFYCLHWISLLFHYCFIDLVSVVTQYIFCHFNILLLFYWVSQSFPLYSFFFTLNFLVILFLLVSFINHKTRYISQHDIINAEEPFLLTIKHFD